MYNYEFSKNVWDAFKERRPFFVAMAQNIYSLPDEYFVFLVANNSVRWRRFKAVVKYIEKNYDTLMDHYHRVIKAQRKYSDFEHYVKEMLNRLEFRPEKP